MSGDGGLLPCPPFLKTTKTVLRATFHPSVCQSQAVMMFKTAVVVTQLSRDHILLRGVFVCSACDSGVKVSVRRTYIGFRGIDDNVYFSGSFFVHPLSLTRNLFAIAEWMSCFWTDVCRVTVNDTTSCRESWKCICNWRSKLDFLIIITCCIVLSFHIPCPLIESSQLAVSSHHILESARHCS